MMLQFSIKSKKNCLKLNEHYKYFIEMALFLVFNPPWVFNWICQSNGENLVRFVRFGWNGQDLVWSLLVDHQPMCYLRWSCSWRQTEVWKSLIISMVTLFFLTSGLTVSSKVSSFSLECHNKCSFSNLWIFCWKFVRIDSQTFLRLVCFCFEKCRCARCSWRVRTPKWLYFLLLLEDVS